MWNYTYRWQRHARFAVGLVSVLALAIALLIAAASTAGTRTWAGVGEVLRDLGGGRDGHLAVMIPASLAARPGTLIYLQRPDGAAQVIGRVVSVEPVAAASDGVDENVRVRIHGIGTASATWDEGGVLKGADASMSPRSVAHLLVSPNTPAEEARLAREAIWPSVQTNVMPILTKRVANTLSQQVTDPGAADQALFDKTCERLSAALKPLEDELIDRLAKRTWRVVGVKGVLAGLWRVTANGAEDQTAALADWWSQLMGEEMTSEAARRPFLSAETAAELEAAIADETQSFWQQHREQIIAAVRAVLTEQAQDFQTAFNDRWANRLLDEAVLPAWNSGEAEVLEAVRRYANDFADRRLLTPRGGPRLLFAYSLRSALKISNAPLLIFDPTAKHLDGKIVYEPLLP